MVFIPRTIAIISLLLSSLTVIRPRSGWGRLVLFIPKLFAGSYIVSFAMFGIISAVTGWILFGDTITLVIALCAVILSARHVVRIVVRALALERKIEKAGNQPIKKSNSMLPFPWIVFWGDSAITPCRRDIPVGLHVETGESILADLWSPPKTVETSGLGLIYLHGSGWHYADKDFGTRHFFRHLACQGYVILDVAYTLAPRTDIFGMVSDVKRAIYWMKHQAQDIDVHPERVVIAGGSAGGHLALLAAYTPNHPRFDPADVRGDTSVRGAISYYGPSDLRQQYDRFMELPGLSGRHGFERRFMKLLENRFEFEVFPVHDLLPSVMGGTPVELPDIYDLASPCEHANEQCPPTLLLQGTHDFSGVSPQVRHLHEALVEAGCPSFLMEFPDTEHGFDLYKPKWSPAAQAATYITERFLAYLA